VALSSISDSTVRNPREFSGVEPTFIRSQRLALESIMARGDAPTVFTLLLLVASAGIIIGLPGRASGHVPHAPIFIDSNDAFTPENGVTGGSGTSSDPYIIEGWEVDAAQYPVTNRSFHGAITVRNASAYFVIRNVDEHSGNVGISLWNVTHGRLERSAVFHNAVGVSLRGDPIYNPYFGRSATYASGAIAGNRITDNRGNGIVISYAKDASVEYNTILNTSEGLPASGISVIESDRVAVRGNDLRLNSRGIFIRESSNVTVTENAVTSSVNSSVPRAYASGTAVLLEYSSHNRIFRNSFFGGGYSDFRALAVDSEGAENTWDGGYTSGGNYWSGYGGVDKCRGVTQSDCTASDDIGDTPVGPLTYVANVRCPVDCDRYPLMSPYIGTPSSNPGNDPTGPAVLASSGIVAGMGTAGIAIVLRKRRRSPKVP
jgi:parallel beta-helix repeat protein